MLGFASLWYWKCPEIQGKVGREGVEPSPDFSERILSPRRLPFRHRPVKTPRIFGSVSLQSVPPFQETNLQAGNRL